MKKNIFIIIVVAIFASLILSGVAYYFFVFNKAKTVEEKPIACAMDVKKCSDGSFVGRIPPDCEFAPCPEASGEASGEESGEASGDIAMKKVLLYYYNPEKDKDEKGNVKCSRDGLVAVEKEINVNNSSIPEVIKFLLKGKENLSEEEKAQGITTEFPLEGFSLSGVNLKSGGVLVLTFDDPLNKTSGGSCRAGILWFQIEETAKQFEGVKEVTFLPEELFQP